MRLPFIIFPICSKVLTTSTYDNNLQYQPIFTFLLHLTCTDIFFFAAELRTKWAAKRRKTTNMTRSCAVYSGKLILTVQVFLYKLALGMDENAPNLELKHSGLCRIGCRSRIFDICFVQKVLLHTPYTSSSLLRKATTARCYRSRGPLFPCYPEFFGFFFHWNSLNFCRKHGFLRKYTRVVRKKAWVWSKTWVFCRPEFFLKCQNKKPAVWLFTKLDTWKTQLIVENIGHFLYHKWRCINSRGCGKCSIMPTITNTLYIHKGCVCECA